MSQPLDVALVASSQEFLRRRMDRRQAIRAKVVGMNQWLEKNFAGQEEGAEIVMPEDRLLRDALQGRGLRVAMQAWDDPAVDWSAAKLCVVRSPSDWYERREEFLSWADKAETVTKLWNSAAVLRWASSKDYLAPMYEKGLDVVPSCICLPLHDRRLILQRLLERQQWARAVVKPMVGQGSRDIIRTSLNPAPGFKPMAVAQKHLDRLMKRNGAVVQPFFPSVQREGEISVVWMQGRATHAVRKYPNVGDFRAYGMPMSREEPIPLNQELSDLAARTMEAVGMPIEFGRLDVVVDNRRRMTLLEMELLQPRLFLSYSAEALGILADGICAAVKG